MRTVVLAIALFIVASVFFSFAEKESNELIENKKSTTMKFKVEIWSDVMCPFCYIGKRKFEAALAQFPGRENVEIVWKSFQLQPDMKTDPTKNSIQHLAESKGWTMEYTRQAVANVVNMAKEVGLNYDFDKAVVANSFDAHRLSHYANSLGKGDAMEEALFKAYFIDGKNTADYVVLTALAVGIGLNEASVREVLQTNRFSDEVRKDIYESTQIGVSGVPFYLFNDKYAVSGAQDSKVFLQTLTKAYSEWQSTISKDTIDIKAGAVCTPQGECK
jgi:predicted DsbA family dithiol-disulfide isomerase